MPPSLARLEAFVCSLFETAGIAAVTIRRSHHLGYPGTPNPVLVDICASITTTSMTRQKVAEGTHFAQPWLLDHEGRATTDPRVLEHDTPRGSLQLIGGLDHGHKGFGLADHATRLGVAMP